MEPKEVQKYMEHLVQLLRQQFGEQLLYVGLQGSCRRGEATKNSDIDAVVVLEELSIPHLPAVQGHPVPAGTKGEKLRLYLRQKGTGRLEPFGKLSDAA